jgi:regulator of protease activity HflC (stomatin/prohibitin superfamily)
MITLLTSIISALVLSVVVFVATKKNKGLTVATFIIVFVVGIGASLVSIVPANNVGIVYSEFGGTQDVTFDEGINLKMPWESVYQINTEVTGLNFEEVSVQTGNSQWVKTTLQVQLAVDRNNALAYFKKHRTKSIFEIQSLIRSTIQRELEAETTKYDVHDLLGQKRADIVTAVNERLRLEFMNDGIRLDRVILVDTDAGDEIEASIAREAAAKKDAETAVHLKKKAQEEGEALKISAELAAEAKILEATGEAEALRLVAEALAENPRLIEMKWIEKWDGVVPTVSSGDSGIILDLSSLSE